MGSDAVDVNGSKLNLGNVSMSMLLDIVMNVVVFK